MSFTADYNQRLSEEEGRIIINTANRIGESVSEKDCYWVVYEKIGQYYISLQEESKCVWEVSKKDAELYNEVPHKNIEE